MTASASANPAPSADAVDAAAVPRPCRGVGGFGDGTQSLRTLAILSALMALRPDLDRPLPARAAGDGGRSAVQSRRDGMDDLGLSDRLQPGTVDLGPDRRPVRTSRAGGGGHRAVRDRLCRLRSLDKRGRHDRLAAVAGGGRLRRRRACARDGARSLRGPARSADAVDADHGDGHRALGRADRRRRKSCVSPRGRGYSGCSSASRSRLCIALLHAAGNPAARSGGGATGWRTRCAAISGCSATGACSATRRRAPASTSASSPISRVALRLYRLLRVDAADLRAAVRLRHSRASWRPT